MTLVAVDALRLGMRLAPEGLEGVGMLPNCGACQRPEQQSVQPCRNVHRFDLGPIANVKASAEFAATTTRSRRAALSSFQSTQDTIQPEIVKSPIAPS